MKSYPCKCVSVSLRSNCCLLRRRLRYVSKTALGSDSPLNSSIVKHSDSLASHSHLLHITEWHPHSRHRGSLAPSGYQLRVGSPTFTHYLKEKSAKYICHPHLHRLQDPRERKVCYGNSALAQLQKEKSQCWKD